MLKNYKSLHFQLQLNYICDAHPQYFRFGVILCVALLSRRRSVGARRYRRGLRPKCPVGDSYEQIRRMESTKTSCFQEITVDQFYNKEKILILLLRTQVDF